MSINSNAPLLMIAMDAADPSLIEKWTDDGTLPNLKRLREQGSYGRLASTADWLAGSVWPTFYTGTPPSDHGIYHFLQWNSEQMGLVRPTPDWLPAHPFWRSLSRMGKRAVAIDVPMTYPPKPFDGVEVSGWATHDRLAPPACQPQSLANWIHTEIGPAPIPGEPYGPLPAKTLLQLRDRLLAATHYISRLAETIMNREPADLYLVAFTATHTGGHKFWNLSGIKGAVTQAEQAELSDALRKIYAACDKAIGQLMDIVGNQATIMVFSLHGMGPNTNRADILPLMLNRILGGDEKPESFGLLKRLRERVPLQLRHAVKQRLPTTIQDQLTAFWRIGGINWAATPALCEVADLQGYIRINLKGREVQGIVEPGEEYERLCQKIIEGLHTFVDADTNEPIVDKVIRGSMLFPNRPTKSDLPDLLVSWISSPASTHREIISPLYGTIPWPTPGHCSDGRSGNHRSEGFLVGAGDRIPSESQLRSGHILNLAPTAYALLELPIPKEMVGKPLWR